MHKSALSALLTWGLAAAKSSYVPKTTDAAHCTIVDFHDSGPECTNTRCTFGTGF